MLWPRHPWLSTLSGHGPLLGPNTMRLLEFGVGPLDGFGLPIDEMLSLYGPLDGYVQNFARGEVAWAEQERRTGTDMQEWMIHNSPYIRRLMDSGSHPIFSRIVRDARQPHMDPEARFQYGLDRVLDSIAASLPA
jgi:hypothetical protein